MRKASVFFGMKWQVSKVMYKTGTKNNIKDF